MVTVTELYWQFQSLMERGGPMMWMLWIVIFAFSLIAANRAFYLWRIYPRMATRAISVWYRRGERTSWYAFQIRRAILSAIKDKLERGVGLMQALVAVCPLIGLLGTVTGMIAVFDVLTATGNNDARAIASGVSQATITTMGGMVGALIGLFLLSMVRRSLKSAYAKLEDQLHMDIA